MAVQLPRVFTPPLRDLSEPDASWGHDFIWFCDERLGEPLSDWQEWLAVHSLEVLTKEKAIEFALLEDEPEAELAKVERLYSRPVVRGGRPIPNGRLRFTKVVILIARQNGKTDFVKKLLKWALFRKRMKDVMAAAQTLNKAIDLWNEVLLEVERDKSLSRNLGRVDHSKGGQTMWTKGKRGRYRPVGIDENAGRGDTLDLLYIDELRTQKDFTGVNALEATTTVPDNGLIITTSNAGSDHSVVLRDYRQLAMKPIVEKTWNNTRQGLFEWSADPSAGIDDEDAWRQANPDLGNGRITIATLRAARESTPEATFRTERLCQWVDELADDKQPLLDVDEWNRFFVDDAKPTGDMGLAVDLSWSSAEAAIVAAVPCGSRYFLSLNPLREFDRVETVDAVVRAVDLNDPVGVALEMTGERSTLAHPLESEGIDVTRMSRLHAADASALLLQLFREGRLIHDGSARWVEALYDAELKETSSGSKRIVGSPVLVAASFAVWLAQQFAIPSSVDVKRTKRFVGRAKPVRSSGAPVGAGFDY